MLWLLCSLYQHIYMFNQYNKLLNYELALFKKPIPPLSL